MNKFKCIVISAHQFLSQQSDMLIDVLKFFLIINIINLHERYAIFHQQTSDMYVRSQKKTVISIF